VDTDAPCVERRIEVGTMTQVTKNVLICFGGLCIGIAVNVIFGGWMGGALVTAGVIAISQAIALDL
jgi:hypothetical protein